MAKSQTKASDLRGPSIYQGEKVGTLFFDIFSKGAYVIPNSKAYMYDDYKTYLVIGIILAICAGLYGKFHVLITIAIIAAIVAIGRFIFQKKCLDDCVAVDYVPPKKEFFLKTWSKEIKTKNLIIIIALSFFMLILCTYNISVYKDEAFLKTGYIILSIVSGVFALCIIACLIMKLVANSKKQK